MKKKILIILTGILLLSPSYIKADAIETEVYPYKVIAIRDTEARCNEELKIKKGEVLEIIAEVLVNDVLIFKHNKEECEIEMGDVKVQTKEFDISKVKNKIIFKNEVGFYYWGYDMKYGPSIMYETMQKIPDGAKINILGTFDGWYYIEYNNKKGWIDDLLTKYEGDYINPRTQYIFSDQDGENAIGTIPAGTKITSMYSTEYSEEDGLSYITYNGITGYVLYTLFQKIDDDMILDYDGRMYEEANTDSKVLIYKIKEGTNVHVDYGLLEDSDGHQQSYPHAWYYTNYNGKKGWIYLKESFYEEENYKENINFNSITFKKNNIKINEKLDINIKLENNNEEEIKKILLYFKNQNNEDKLVYINDINTKPYIKIENSDFDDEEYTLENIELEMDDSEQTKVVYSISEIENQSDYKIFITKSAEEKKNETKEQIKEIHKINNKHLYIGIGSAISITITSIILIILINKRRKAK